jgi:hypothetical protein
MKAERLEAQFASRAVQYSGNMLLLRPDDAIALVNSAADEGVPVLGVDALQLTEQSTVSPLDHLADFSKSVAEGHGCWEEAESFIRERAQTGLVFGITLGDDPVEAV